MRLVSTKIVSTTQTMDAYKISTTGANCCSAFRTGRAGSHYLNAAAAAAARTGWSSKDSFSLIWRQLKMVGRSGRKEHAESTQHNDKEEINITLGLSTKPIERAWPVES